MKPITWEICVIDERTIVPHPRETIYIHLQSPHHDLIQVAQKYLIVASHCSNVLLVSLDGDTMHSSIVLLMSSQFMVRSFLLLPNEESIRRFDEAIMDNEPLVVRSSSSTHIMVSLPWRSRLEVVVADEVCSSETVEIIFLLFSSQ